MGELASRCAQSNERFGIMQNRLERAQQIVHRKACVYVTGSFGRGEASSHSDLDVFIVSKAVIHEGGERERLLTRLDAIQVKSDLIDVTRDMSFPKFSGDGRWLGDYSVLELTEALGKREDDALNTFTARLLLLLESRALLEDDVYRDIIAEVIEPYWKDYDAHHHEFVPAFLTNDILRLWRTFCVNYEAHTSTEPTKENAKRKSKNYKLKHSRLLTCYSALLFLLAIYGRNGTVSRDDVIEMTRLTPTSRLEWLLSQSDVVSAHPAIKKLIEDYEAFLETTNISEDNLIDKFLDKEISREYMSRASTFGQAMFEALTLIGNKSRLHRLLIV